MMLLNRVLWREGMHLSQHHFQAQGRYVEDTIAAALGQLLPGSWGVTHLQLDTDAVRNGMAVVREARGIMPDGMPFTMPESDVVPAPRAFAAAFSPTQQAHVLHLVIRRYAPNGSNTGANGEVPRYRPLARPMQDAVTGADTTDVEVAQRDFRLVLDHELRPDDADLPVARIVRDGTGRFTLDADFLPPCTKLSGSERLLQMVRDVIGQLEAKGDALVAARQDAATDLANYAAHEVAGFWMLHTIRSHLAGLRHHLFTRETHPERLYLDLARLAGELSTFTLHTSPADVPAYDHRNPGACFPALVRLVQSSLETVVPASAERFALVVDGPNFHGAAVTDERAYRGTEWILGVKAGKGDLSVAARVPQLLKVCSRVHLPRLVQDGRTALGLVALHAPPAAISPRPGTAYFQLQLSGNCWDAIQKTRAIGVYVPDSIPGVALDLFVVRTG